MKMFGNSRGSRHTGNSRQSTSRNASAVRQTQYSGNYGGTSAHGGSASARHRRKAAKKRRALRVFVVLLAIVITLATVVVAMYKLGVKPPSVNTERRPGSSSAPVQSGQPLSSDAPEISGDVSGRNEKAYTFVVLGKDKVSNNTDTIMVVRFDTTDYTVNVVSIPRDTLVNVSWSTKKVNTLYAVGGTDRMKEGLADIIGFEVDFYVVVDLQAFETLVDAIGGVYYDVPRDMDYDDPAQDLHIHVKKGPQMLNGAEAVGVMRFRKGYANADIGRIGTQQDFLMTVANQVLENKDDLNLGDLVNIFLNYVETDLNYGEIIWLAQEFYKTDTENISFQTLPGNYGDSVRGTSYVTIYVDEWLEMVNTSLNPFYDDITLGELSILTRDTNTKKLYSTNGVYAGDASWGNSGSSSGGNSGSSATATPKPSATPTPTPKPSASPSPSPSPSSDVTPTPSPSADVTPTPSDSSSSTAEPTPSGGGTPDGGVEVEGTTAPAPESSATPAA